MTAAAFLQILNQLLYLAVAVAVIVEAARRPRRTSIDTALFFTALALILDLTGLSTQLGFAIPSTVSLGLAALLLALPFIQLRLLDDFVGVGAWTKRAALAGLVLSIGAMVLLPSPVPGILTLALVLYFVTVLSYCAVRFLRESRRAHSLVAARLLAVAVGSGLLSVVLAIAVTLPFVLPGGAEVTRLVTQLVILAAGVSYFLGFAPPSLVKRLWQESALRHFMQEMNRFPQAGSLDEVMRRLEIAAGTATAGSRALIAVWDEAKAVLQFTTPNGTVHTVDTRTTVTLGGRVVQERRPILSEDPARDYPSGAEMYRRLGVKAVVGAPIVVRGRVFGVLAVQSSHPSLFGRDDVEFLGLLADQIGVAVENSQLLAEVRRLTAEERRLGEAARSRLATIVESSPDAIIGSSLDGLVTDWNPAAERIYGYTADEAVGSNLVVVPADRADEGPQLLGRILGGESIEQFETERIRKDGTRFHVSLGFAALRDAGGTIHGVATFARDITEQVAAKEREADLEARLRQSERLESVGLLAGGIAHDFNNLLAIVLNYASFIEDKLPDDTELRDDLLQIRRAAERGAVFTRQLLTFAHQRPVKVADLQLNEVIPALQQMLRRSIPESIAIELRLAPDLWTVRADAGQLEQLLLNLVVNAGDAMADGGTLLIETANARYDETAAAQLANLVPGPYVSLTVTDTGHGMSKEVIGHAFEPFFTTKPTGKGTGLGLATVYGITKQAGGNVSIYSEVGRGTSIRVLLPAQLHAVTPITSIVVEPPANEVGERGNVTILLVEDEPAVRTAAVRILRSAGYAVIEASSPVIAIELASTEARIDLLVTDMVMPGMSGRDLSRNLRADRPDLGVVYMSGYSEELVMRDSELDGPLLQKPFTRESLLLIVRDAVRTQVRTRGSPVPTA
ncbi:MAG: PAS domain S-box protein [Chloroflexota bacterium]|nr:PAS domain S-box protein [Chloroflexota bacterium]